MLVVCLEDHHSTIYMMGTYISAPKSLLVSLMHQSAFSYYILNRGLAIGGQGDLGDLLRLGQKTINGGLYAQLLRVDQVENLLAWAPHVLPSGVSRAR